MSNQSKEQHDRKSAPPPHSKATAAHNAEHDQLKKNPQRVQKLGK